MCALLVPYMQERGPVIELRSIFKKGQRVDN